MSLLIVTVLCKSNANKFRRNFWVFGAFGRNFASHDISLTNRDSSPHFRHTYCLERPDLSSDIWQCTVVCCNLSHNNSLLVKVHSKLSWKDLSAFKQTSQWRKYETRISISLLRCMKLGESAFPHSSCKLIDQLLLTTYLVSLQEKLKSELDPKSKKQRSLFFKQVDSHVETWVISCVNAMYVV